MKPVHVIINPSAGRGRAASVLPRVIGELQSHGIEYHVTETVSLSHAKELALEAAKHDHIAAALGGDGLVGAVASATADAGGVLAVIPGGRGNDLARVLGIPIDPKGSVEVIARGNVDRIDLGQANGKTFCCIASCGFDSDANRIANEASVPGAIVYFYAALKALWDWRPARFRLRLDGVEAEMFGYSVIVANSKAYGAGMFIAPNADLTDGLLDVVTISESSKLRFLLNLPSVFKGKHLDAPTVQASRAKTVFIDADRPFTVYADGDPLCDLPAEITVLPQAVKILLP